MVTTTINRAMLGKYADMGLELKEVGYTADGITYELYFKGEPTGRRFSELWATTEGLKEACRQFLKGLEQ